MIIIIPYLGVAILAGLISLKLPVTDSNDIGPYLKQRKSYIKIIIIIFISVFVFAAFRHITATAIDESIYRRRLDWYRTIPFSQAVSGDAPLFAAILWLSNLFFPTSQGGIIVTSALTLALFFIAFVRDCKDFSFAIVLFFVTECFFSTFNGISQWLAAAVFLYGYKYICDRKLVKYIVVILIATMIHSASIVLLPLYFIANIPAFSKKAFIYDIAILAFMVIGYRNLTPIITRLGILQDYVGSEMAGHRGVNYLTILISLAPAAISYFISQDIDTKDSITNVSANLTILNGLIMIASSMDVYITRLSLFTSAFSIVFLSRISLYVEERNNLLKPLIIFLYALVFIIRYRSGVYYFFQF